MKSFSVFLVMLLVLSMTMACSGQVTIKKNVGDDVLVTVLLANAEQHAYVGFDLNYPSIVAPVIPEGTKVAFDEGDIYAGHTFETLCNKGTGNTVVVSKVLKESTPLVQNGSVVMLRFKCTAIGSGTFTLEDRNVGYVAGGIVHNYSSDAAAMPVTFTAPATTIFIIEVQ
jgi:hypothetical protein